MIDADWAQFVWNVLTSAAVALTWLYIWAGKRQAATRKEIGKVYERVGRLEAAAARLAPIDGMHELAVAIERLSGDARVIAQRIAGIEDLVERLERVTSRQEDFLLRLNKQ